ncbi:Gag-Pol polyprotein [Nosema granulosis]|uniref:Gag-Pol polyprotein n=1 Tax=Nosema granulosis TaxID=83296 RepID=A0A9P6KXU7_9MICR|nr:Gag-Pol polyprotein [Nosema granulosis]
MIDHFSKCAEAIPVYTKDMNTIVHLVDKYIVKKYGPQKVILTDNGREFKNQVCESFAKERNIIWRFGSPYKPTTTGPIERFYRTLVSKLREITGFGKYDWAKCVRKADNAYKQTYHRAIGCAPIEIMKGMVLTYMDRQENIEVNINRE